MFATRAFAADPADISLDHAAMARTLNGLAFGRAPMSADQQVNLTGAPVQVGGVQVDASVFTGARFNPKRLDQEQMLMVNIQAPASDNQRVQYHFTGILPMKKNVGPALPLYIEQPSQNPYVVVGRKIKTRVSAGVTIKF